MSVPKSAVRHIGRPFLFLRQVSDLFSCPLRSELLAKRRKNGKGGGWDEGRSPIRELVQPEGNGK